MRVILFMLVVVLCQNHRSNAQQEIELCTSLLAKTPGPPGEKGEMGPAGDCQCGENKIKELEDKLEQLDQFYQHIPIVEKVQLCEVGIKSGSVPDSAITASSYWNNHPRHEPRDGRLDGPTNDQSAGCWAPNNADNAWIQVKLEHALWFAGVVTQGRARDYVQWYTKYKVEYGMSESDLKFIQEDGSDKIFDGNVDRASYALGSFPKSVLARIIRVYPTAHNNIQGGCLRFGVVTC